MKTQKDNKILVAMSGGVDSSVAALLLANKYPDRVIGGFVRGYNVDGCQDKDLEDARAVAQHIDIPFYVFDFEEEYKKRVVDYMLDGYKKGITPNPDVVCNSQIKFGLLYKKAMEMGCEYVTSGHYAQIKHSLFGRVGVWEGRDDNKDQSYFLWQVPFKRFEHILFPVGHLKKDKVRDIARDANLPVAEKKDSQGVCFLGKFDFAEFLKQHIPSQKGVIVDTQGKEVGQHDGVWFYTLGQRHGFSNTAGVPFFVVEKDIKNNRLIVAYEGDEALLSDEVLISDFNFLDDKMKREYKKGKEINVMARLRYRAPLESAKLARVGADRGKLLFDKKAPFFPAVGQSAVFYNNRGKLLGGGVII